MGIDTPLIEAVLAFLSQHNYAELKWLASALTFLLPWVFWTKVIDKERIHEIFNYGLLWALILTLLYLCKQQYLLGNLRSLSLYAVIPIHLALLPVVYMILYQVFVTPLFFYVAVIIVSTLVSFLFEAILYLSALSQYPTVSYLHSLCSLVFIASINKLFLEKYLQRKAQPYR